MNNTHWSTTCFIIIFILIGQVSFAGNTPCSATPLPNNMTTFQSYSNLGNTDSGVPAPDCGNYVNADFWFSVTVPASGNLDIATLAGTMSNAAMAIYEGSCSNPDMTSCTEDDNCGNTIMPIMNLTNLTPGTTLYIRIWAEGGGPNGDFEIRVSDGPIPVPPIPTTSTVGTAQYTSEDCVQLTTTAPGQTGCAWDPTQINLNNPFDETFVFNFGTVDANGADGICWAFQNNPSGLNTCGNTGMNIAGDFNNSFIVEFDTWDNGFGFSDIPDDHVAVNINGDMGNAINGPFSLGNIEDGQDHEIRFVWDPATNGYEIYFDGLLTLSGNYDIITNCLGGNPNCYWGFTASTGGATNNHTVCPVPVPEFPAGDESTVEVEICEGESYFAGGANQTTSGTYTDVTPLPNGCSSTLNTILTVRPAGYFTYDAAVCQGDCEQVGTELFCTTGNYDVILDGQAWNGCDSIVTLNLTVLNPIAVAFQPAPITCFNMTTLIDASPSTSAPGIVSYSWVGPSPDCILSGQNTLMPVVSCPGMYTLTLVQILNGTACSVQTTIEIIDGAILPTAEAGDDQNFDCDNSCVTLSSLGSDTGADINLTWTGPNSFSSNEPNPEVCEAGVYTLNILNLATGCLATDMVTVTGTANPPDLAATVSGLITCETNTVTLDGSASTGIGTLSFEWFDDGSMSLGQTAMIDVMTTGTYTLVITDDANGCTADTMLIVTGSTDAPIAIATVSDVLDCTDGPVVLDGSMSSGMGALSLEWQNLSGDSIGEGSMIEVTMSGVYILEVTDEANGCTASTSIQVLENTTPPQADASVSGVLTCTDLEVTLDASGSTGGGMLGYEWQAADGTPLGMGVTINVTTAEIYTLIVTDASNGCTATTTIEVEENIIAPTPVATVDELLTCTTMEVTLDGSASSGIGTLTYEWQDMDGMTVGDEATLTINNTKTYTLIITDAENGCTALITINADENTTPPIANAVVDELLTCSRTEVTLDAGNSSGMGMLSYEWLDADNMTVGTAVTLEVTDTELYTLIVTDGANGCTATTTINADQDITAPISDAGADAFITCSDSETTLNGSASSTGSDYTYEWINEGNVTVGMDVTVDVTETGTYTLIVRDMTNGCTATSTVDVNPDADLPIADAGSGAVLTCVVEMVNLDGSNSSAGTNITYEWLAPDNTSLGDDLSIDVMEVGTYTLVVTNTDNGCTATSSVEVTENIDDPVAIIETPNELTCTDTEITLNAENSTGGTLGFEWFDEMNRSIGIGSEVTVDEVATYTLVLMDQDNGCTTSATVSVDANDTPPVADAGMDGLLTCEVINYTLDASNSSGGMLTYEWQDAMGMTIGGDALQEVSTSEIFTLIITDQTNGCTASDTVEITSDTQAPIADAGNNQVLDCRTDIVTLDGVNSMGIGTLNYEWWEESGMSIETAVTTEVNTAGTYTLIIRDTGNGCTASSEVDVIGDFEKPVVNLDNAATLTCTDTLVLLSGANSTGNGILSFEWFDAINNSIILSPTVVVKEPGDYTLVVTNIDNGCTESETIAVSQNIVPPTADAGSDAFLTCEDTEATLTGSGTSQSGMLSFEWQNAGGLSVGNFASVIVTEVGVYTLITTDLINGCTASATAAVNPDANLPVADAGLSATLNCNLTEVLLDGGNSSTGTNITYEWQDENNTSLGTALTQTANSAGVYTLMVTDLDNGCSASSSVEVFEDITPPNTIAGMDTVLTCENDRITLDGSLSTVALGMITSYEWYDTNAALLASTESLEVDTDGVYTLVVTGSNGCTASDEVLVTLDANIPEAITGPGGLLTCKNPTLDLGVLGSNIGLNVAYQWTNSNGTLMSSTPTIEVTTPDLYTLTVTNLDNNCIATNTIEILQDITPPIADAGMDATLTCTLTEYELGGIGTSSGIDFSYDWRDANNMNVSDQINPIISGQGVYTLVVTNEINGCTASATITIDKDIQNPIADAGADGILTCDISEVTLNGSASSGTNLAFEWQNEAGVIIDTAPITQVGETGVFTLIVTNTQNGCTAEARTTVTPDANLPTAIAIPDNILTCTRTMVNVDASTSTSVSGMTTFDWQDASSMSISDQNNIDVTTPGIYTLIVRDEGNGCSASTTVEILQDIVNPIADAGPTQTLICGQTEVTLNGTGSNGTNLSYEWQNMVGTPIGNQPSITVTTAGVYTLIVQNETNGCSSSASVAVIPDTNLPTAEAGVGGTLDCETTELTLNGTGSSTGTNFTYEWQDEAGVMISMDLMATVNTPGLYTLTILDLDNNCTAQDQVLIEQDIIDPDAFADYGSAQSLDCNNPAITLDGSGSSPFGNLSFQWSTTDGNITAGATTINPEVDQAGTYTLIVTNTLNGCTNETMITVDENVTPPTVVINDPDLLTCVTTMVTLDATASSVGNFSYDWTGSGIVAGANTLEAVIEQAGLYTLTVIDNENGCTNDASITVDENITPPIAAATVSDELDCMTESISLDGAGSSEGAGISYEWEGSGMIENATTISPMVSEAGVYQLVVTDAANGCTDSADVMVTEDTNVPTSFELDLAPPQCFGDLANIAVLNVEGGNAPYLFSLDNGLSFSSQAIFTNLPAGNYNLIVQDANGCEYTESLMIAQPEEVSVAIVSDDLIALGEDYQFQVIPTIDEAEIDTIIWSPGTGLSCADCLNPRADSIVQQTTYSVTIVNENGCAATDQITLRVKKDRAVFIPNVFSPNGDGTNDEFMIFADGKDIQQVDKFQVFDRWGELVFSDQNFQPNDITHSWNGTLRGEELNAAVFVYWAEITFIDGVTILYKGDVTIIK